MRPDLPDVLRCPRCGSEHQFTVDGSASDERELRSGTLTCTTCGHLATIEDGIVDLLHEPPEFVRREAAGLERVAQRMRDDGWDRERILALPYDQSGYWFAQAAAMEHLLAVQRFDAGGRLLDIGANTCWASNIFAKQGLNVVALDIAATEMQGLATADWWFDDSGVYFERILSSMFDLALASDSFDYVFCCEVLHHNDPTTLRRTFKEIHRVLKPGGKLLVINEPLKFLTNFKRDHAQEVAEYEGYEHVYFLHQYLLAAKRAGLRLRIVRPNTTPFFRGEPLLLEASASPREAVARALQQVLRRNRRGSQAYTLYSLLFGPDISLSFMGQKPA